TAQFLPFFLILLEESKTKCSRHSEAAVVRRAAAEPDNDLIRATARGSNQHFADAKCVRAKWIAFAGRESAHPRRLTHFHDCEFAFPLESFITCPFRKLSDTVLPALKSAAGFGLAAITWSQSASIALASLNCSIPFSLTMSSAPFPLANISAKTSLPCLPLIL